MLKTGAVLGGYRIEDVLGIGGSATVYRAEQMALGRHVALKVLAPELSRDEAFRERFEREGKHAAQLEHPNIVTVHDSGEFKGLRFLAMRFIDGPNLAQLIEDPGLSPESTIALLRPIAKALDAAHASKLVHRDVKPHNILVGEDDHPYLTDFGVAKATHGTSVTKAGGFIGSVHYASPEQIRDRDASPACDVYALTAVLHQCLTGYTPYPYRWEERVMRAHVNEPPPRLLGLAGADRLNAVIARGMAKDPAARYPTAGALIEAAGGAVEDLPETVRSSTDRLRTSAATIASSESGPVALGLHRVEQGTRVSVGRRRWSLLFTVLAACLVALVLVLSPWRRGSRSLHVGALTLTLPAGVHAAARESPIVPGLALASSRAFASADVGIEVGRVESPAVVPGGLPPGVRHDIGSPSFGGPVSVGRASALRYRWTKGASEELDVFVIPAEPYDLAIACVSSTAIGAVHCMALVSSVRVDPHGIVQPGPQTAVARHIVTALAPATRARSAREGMDSASLSTRAATASVLAAADARSASAVGTSTVPRLKASLSSVSQALVEEARTLRSLVIAARSDSRGDWQRARAAAVARQADLAAALAPLRSAGYRGASLPAIPIPAMAAAPHRSSTTAPSEAETTITVTTPQPVVAPTDPGTQERSSRHFPKEEYGPTVVAEPKG